MGLPIAPGLALVIKNSLIPSCLESGPAFFQDPPIVLNFAPFVRLKMLGILDFPLVELCPVLVLDWFPTADLSLTPPPPTPSVSRVPSRAQRAIAVVWFAFVGVCTSSVARLAL